MRIQVGNAMYTISIKDELIDYEHAVVIDNNVIYLPYCRDMDYYYSVANNELRDILRPYIVDLVSKDTRENINYSIPSLWIVVHANGYIRIAVSHNTTYDGEDEYDPALETTPYKCFTTANEKRHLLDKVRFLW